MSSLVPATEYVFKDPQIQRAANNVYEYVAAFNAANAATGIKYQFKTDYERMQYMIGREGRVVHSILVPTPPQNVTGTIGNTVAYLNWLAPLLSEAPVIYYKIVSTPPTTTFYAVNTNVVFTGLTNLTAYIFTVYAKNLVGFSLPALSTALIPHDVPTQPRNVTATAGYQQVDVSWDAPLNDNGGPIDIYTVTSHPDNITATVSAPTTTVTVTGLTNETPYTFTVTAHNESGNSAPSAASSAVTPSATVNVTVDMDGIIFGDPETGGYHNTITFSTATTIVISFSNIDSSIDLVTHIGFTRSLPNSLLSNTDTFRLLYPNSSPDVSYVLYPEPPPYSNSQIYTNYLEAGPVSATTNIVVTVATPITSMYFNIY